MKVSTVGFKAKTLVAAVALAASSMASAMVLPITGNGNLTFSIWDATIGKEASMTLDLGVGMNTALSSYLTPGTTINFGNVFSQATYTSEFGFATGGHNLADLRWNVVAGDISVADQERALLTNVLGSDYQIQNTQVQGATTIMSNFLGNFGAATVGGAHTANDRMFAGGTGWNGTLAGQVQNTEGVVGGDLGMYLFTDLQGPDYLVNPGDPAARLVFQNGNNYGTWNLSSTGDLKYSLAPVPVPAALWLLGSAMVGLVGVARRRNNEVA